MKIRIAAPLLMTALAAPAFAIDYTDSAPVISSVPVYQTVNEPQQQCWTESVTSYERYRSPGGAILGGITGGLLGSTIGRGNGRVASAAFGAAIGALVGDHIDNRDNSAVAVTRPVQRCQTVESYRQVLTGYQVTYNYNGRNTTVVLPYDPGPRLPIEVGITGAAGQPVYAGPPVTRIVYEQRPPIWEGKPYRRPRHRHGDDHDWDR
ncbi:MAG TPA: glycine zipper 2TM domain-containing protein [Burkholderiales bacterium]|nr:glycine zipper 2TM domain-containing protein [Burkholderiales bacterium]